LRGRVWRLLPLLIVAALVASLGALGLGGVECGGLCAEIVALSAVLLLLSAALYAFAAGFTAMGFSGRGVAILVCAALASSLAAVAAGLAVAGGVRVLLALLSNLTVAVVVLTAFMRSCSRRV
jgi:hypothetical protein